MDDLLKFVASMIGKNSKVDLEKREMTAPGRWKAKYFLTMHL